MTLVTLKDSPQTKELVDILKKVADILHLTTGVLTVYYQDGGIRGEPSGFLKARLEQERSGRAF